jgi:alkanesulfonate monooxygenase SsuD/methylene tetrahydromethanopterin reductase-like flavin-dependent oxidoreductase (luciferase family)
MGSLNFANWRGPRIFMNPGEAISEEDEKVLKNELTYDFVAPRALFFGSPDQVADKIVELHEATGIDHLMFKCGWPGLAHEHTMRCLERLAGEVLPAVRRRLGASKQNIGTAAE